MERIIVVGRIGTHQRDIIYNTEGISPAINGVGCGGVQQPTENHRMERIILTVGDDGSIIGRRPFWGGSIAMMRLQFSSNLGIAFCVNAERVGQVIIYED